VICTGFSDSDTNNCRSSWESRLLIANSEPSTSTDLDVRSCVGNASESAILHVFGDAGHLSLPLRFPTSLTKKKNRDGISQSGQTETDPRRGKSISRPDIVYRPLDWPGQNNFDALHDFELAN
tara:strand:+ start:130267 stop:130635 length:369 start_codon:yes stop_codon:yes gene_type:complete